MGQIQDVYREVIEKSEWVAIVTAGPDRPHLAGCWTRYALAIGIEDDGIGFPAGVYISRGRMLFGAKPIVRGVYFSKT